MFGPLGDEARRTVDTATRFDALSPFVEFLIYAFFYGRVTVTLAKTSWKVFRLLVGAGIPSLHFPAVQSRNLASPQAEDIVSRFRWL